MILNKSVFSYTILFFWPFLFYFPLTTEFIAMGNDFDLIYYAYKKYIFEFWQDGQIPFWSPSEGAGFTLIYNPFAQFFYIPSWILFLICDLKNSFSLYDYLIYTILGISIYSIGQYQWLKSFKISSNKIKFATTLLVPSILIISNFLRFPNAIHTFCWLPYLLLGINYSFINKKYFKSFLLIFFSTLLILTAGYPYFIFYIFIFSVIYFLFITILYKKKFINIFYVFLKNLLPSSIALILSFPWLYGVLKTLSFAQNRNLKNFEYATGHDFNFVDVLGSWLYPVISNTEGRYYFGIGVTFLVIKFFLDLKIRIFKINKTEKIIIYFALISFLIISFFSITSQTIFFEYIWYKIEFIQNIRTWPRINILMVPVISILLVISLTYFIETFYSKFSEKKYHILSSNIILLIFLSVQLFFYYTNGFDEYWFTWHEKRFLFAKENLPFPINFFVMFSDGRINILSTIILILLINFSFFNKIFLNLINKKLYILFILVLTVSFEQFLNSNLQWSLKVWKTNNTEKNFDAVKNLTKNFYSPRIKKIVHGNNYFRDDAFTINNFLDWGNRFHNRIFWNYFDKYGVVKKKLTKQETLYLYTFFGLNKHNKKIFFTADIKVKDPIEFVKKSEIFEEANNTTYEVKEFNNNYIIIDFYSNANGWLSYIDNLDPFWHANLNGIEVDISKLMNSYKSIYFKKGKNTIKFNYEPFRY